MIRPRGWHLLEKHVLIDGRAVSASIFDFGLFFFHNARTLIKNGTAPYFYLPKLESHQEARLWNDIFVSAQRMLNIPCGTVKATVLTETITAAFEMDEILYELRQHSAGLNCGRWDYIFSFIKKFRNHPAFVLPDRAEVTMSTHFLRAYSLLLIQTCHKEGMRPYLGVLKRHRPDPFLMTHAVDGYSLAMDFAVRKSKKDKLWAMCNRMAEVVLDAGGRFYYAKDAVLEASSFARIHGDTAVAEFRALKQRLDPKGMLSTDLSRRLFGAQMG